MQDRLLMKGIALLDRLEGLLDRLEQRWEPNPAGAAGQGPSGEGGIFRWERRGRLPMLRPLEFRGGIQLEDLLGIDRQKEILVRNTRQFLHGYEANNALLWGARGTGKSSLIRAIVSHFRGRGLALIEVDKEGLQDLPEIVDRVSGMSRRFILFCDDLSLGAGDSGLSSLKALLDGAFSTASDRWLLYATSNRRHLMPEAMETVLNGGEGSERHPGEGIDEQISLSERFGIWLPFYPFSQEGYLEIVFHWLRRFGVKRLGEEEIRVAARQWALARGSRSGRTAWQFARDMAGRLKMRRDREGESDGFQGV